MAATTITNINKRLSPPKRRLRFRLKLELLLYLCGVDQFKQESKNGTNSPCSCSLQMPSM